MVSDLPICPKKNFKYVAVDQKDFWSQTSFFSSPKKFGNKEKKPEKTSFF
jgi:hypothetical protein